MGYLIDTCVISELRKEKPSESVLTWFQSCDEEKTFISALSIGELHHGIERLPDGKKKTELHEWFYQVTLSFSDRILPVTLPISISWAGMRAMAEKKGRQLSVIDGLLAATAKAHELIFVTRNAKDIEFTGILYINPWIA